MPYNAVRTTTTQNHDSVISRLHPPVIVTKAIPSDEPAFEKGTILVQTDTGIRAIEAYDPAADPQQQTVGVAASDYDPSYSDMVEVLIHGTVVEEMMLADADQIALLTSQHPIYTV